MQPLVDAVFFGARHVLVAVEDLQLIEPPGQHARTRAVMPPPIINVRRVKVA